MKNKHKIELKKIEFKNLTDDRLKKYFNSQKLKYFGFLDTFYCEICDEYHFDEMTALQKDLQLQWHSYIKGIKFELNKRKGAPK